MQPSRHIDSLLTIMAALRTPESGCAWDLEQDFRSIAPYTIEEAYEVADAISRGDIDDLKDELGDLLLQVVFHARMAEELGHFDFDDVCRIVADKMVRRHPHVFGDATADDSVTVKRNWETIKAQEKIDKQRRGRGEAQDSLLDDVPLALPALVRAVKLQRRAARVGFDWRDAEQVLEKAREELDELQAAIKENRERAAEEIGDTLFAVANLARHLGVDPEDALRKGNEKFRRRFAHIERRAADAGADLASQSLERMEEWWKEAKRAERKDPG